MEKGISKLFKVCLKWLFILFALVFFFGFVVWNSIQGYLPAQTRSIVARAQAEMRQVATALETYHIDNGFYPPAETKFRNLGTKENGNFSFGLTPEVLTTPIMHLFVLPLDPFNIETMDQEYRPYGYATDGECWILFSHGPDKQQTLVLRSMEIVRLLRDGENKEALNPFTYDPTNGTKSPGDLWRVGY